MQKVAVFLWVMALFLGLSLGVPPGLLAQADKEGTKSGEGAHPEER